MTVSATHDARHAATAASAALPPSARISIPAAVVAGCPAATAACIALFYRGACRQGCVGRNAAAALPLVHAPGLGTRCAGRGPVVGGALEGHWRHAAAVVRPTAATRPSTALGTAR